ncbi:MAG TPA: NfeD family protein [Deltaproteobacteria bacterium]|nr:NfeD family protein [Deltaproteobacteria bacterium]
MMQVLTNPGLLWFLAGVVLLIAELFAPTLVLMFFGFGAWIVAVVYLMLEVSLAWQLALFAASSLILLALLRKRLKPLFKGYTTSRQKAGQDLDDFLGRDATVIETIEPGKPGKIECSGVAWTAESETKLEVGTHVRVTSRSGLKLIVVPR